MVVQRQLDRNRRAGPVDRDPKVAVQRLPSRLVGNSPSSTNPCCSVAINSDSASFRSSHSLDSFRDSDPDLRAVPRLAHSAKEVPEGIRDRNQVRSRFHLVPEVMVDRDRSLAHRLVRSPSPPVVMVDKVDQRRLLVRNRSVAAAMIMVRTEP